MRRFLVARYGERHGRQLFDISLESIARLEAIVVFEELLRRVPDWRVDVEHVEWIHSSSVRGPATLPITP